MEKTTALAFPSSSLRGVREVAIVVGASLFIAACAHITLPLPFSPVPLTLQNFAVLLVGLMLGWRRGLAALVLYLAEGAAGMPMFNPTGPGGLAQLFGPTGGFLLAYPLVAALAGFIFAAGRKTLASALFAGTAAELLLFASGTLWLALLSHSFSQAARFALFWGFLPAELIKVMAAAAIASGCWRARKAVP
jgi:biotin transport system substrate-specific component